MKNLVKIGIVALFLIGVTSCGALVSMGGSTVTCLDACNAVTGGSFANTICTINSNAFQSCDVIASQAPNVAETCTTGDGFSVVLGTETPTDCSCNGTTCVDA